MWAMELDMKLVFPSDNGNEWEIWVTPVFTCETFSELCPSSAPVSTSCVTVREPRETCAYSFLYQHNMTHLRDFRAHSTPVSPTCVTVSKPVHVEPSTSRVTVSKALCTFNPSRKIFDARKQILTKYEIVFLDVQQFESQWYNMFRDGSVDWVSIRAVLGA